MAKKEIDLKPTEGMVKAAQRGLDLRKEFGRGGTDVGVARARDIVNRKNLSPDTVKRMFSFFSRHGAQKVAGWKPGEENYPSAQFIAWLLWGGDPGFSWAKRKRDEIERASKKESATYVESVRGTGELLFSTEIWDHFNNFDEMSEMFFETMFLDDEEVEAMVSELSTEELETQILDWASDMVEDDFNDEQNRIFDLLDSTYESFKVYELFNSWQGDPIKTKGIENSVRRYYERIVSKYGSFESISAFLKNGKLILELRHHDATDIFEIVAQNSRRPVKIVVN